MPRKPTPPPSPETALLDQARRVATTPNPDREQPQTIKYEQPRDPKTGRLKPHQAKK